MRLNRLCTFIILTLVSDSVFGGIPPGFSKRVKNTDINKVVFRENCDNAISQIDQAINNVRARLLSGGDVWWDGTDGRYVVPKVAPGIPEVSSIYAGAVWLGGVDPAGNLKLAAQTYGRSSGDSDFWPGPLNPVTGKTDQETCAKWDRFFVVKGSNIEDHLRKWEESKRTGKPYEVDQIPKDIRGWPGRGNPFFEEIHKFALPKTSQGLAGFWDQDGDGDYNPQQGDFPVIEIRGCTDKPQFPDEMIFWIYNDAGNIHSESRGDPIQMEIQVQAFAYSTNDEINNMTFQRYKLINRAVESIENTYFAMWVDPDLGCSTDDYIGSDLARDLAYVYNEDAADGQSGCVCPGGVNTYCNEIPILGIDYFRGPLNEFGQEIGMSSFTYYNNGGVGSPPIGTTDPNNAQEYYNYLSGSWRDGSPFTFGDDAYQDGDPIKYAFPNPPNDPTGWSMCTAALPFGDRRMIQASGPFRLDPGAVNELIIGAVWVADQDYPCPSIAKLQEADDIAQALFDNCFEITDGPDAPDIDFIELENELIAVFTNDTVISNNAYEGYAQKGLQIPEGEADSLYVFEGYKLFQLSGADVTLSDIEDPSKARLIYQVDINNGISRIFNWRAVENPTGEELYLPVLMVEGSDGGIRHTFRIKEDQFAVGNRRLINHKKYYFVAVAYAHNNYEPYDPKRLIGQRRPYLEGRRNIGDGNNPFYVAVPRPIVDRKLNAVYGEGAIITRIDGVGAGGNFLDISEESKNAILSGRFDGKIVYKEGRGPIDVKIFNPLDVVDGTYELTMKDENMANEILDQKVTWELKSLTNPSAPIVRSEGTIDRLNEQIVREYGFTVNIGQTGEPGEKRNARNGVVGAEITYSKPNPRQWLTGIPDGFVPGNSFLDDVIFDYVANSSGEEDAVLDPEKAFSNIGPGFFVPYYMANFRTRAGDNLPYITPAWTNVSGSSIVRTQSNLSELNNVDIVLTPDKSLWSRCVVIETANRYYEAEGFFGQGNRKHFDLRVAPNVTKDDNNGDGLPDLDLADPGQGMAWFPGYAIDVETGQRLNIFFGENSSYDGTFFPESYIGRPPGNDMMFNPTSQLLLPLGGTSGVAYEYLAGGQHFIYVTKTPYDECALFRNRFRAGVPTLFKVSALKEITWAGFPMMIPGTQMLDYKNGLIPEEVTIKLRVDNSYKNFRGTGQYKGYPSYQFSILEKEASNPDEAFVNQALDQIRMVPNPYLGFSDYEVSQFVNTVKITNLPAVCTVTIYTLDGKFIRQYKRNEIGVIPRGSNRAVEQNQILPDLEWDMKNGKGIPISSGVYLVHIDAGELGQRTLKWFGINRKFDPSGL